MDENKEEIISLFRAKVLGKRPQRVEGEADGAQGHWLERQFGITPNADNAPDLLGYELKNDTKGKTTFGDWQATVYIFDSESGSCTRSEFLRLFGAPNPEKNGRYSWSGKPSPNIKRWNDFGQRLLVDEIGGVYAVYCFAKDIRPNKETLIPQRYKSGLVTLAYWDPDRLRDLVERKFNVKGWFKCLKDDAGAYVEIAFGSPIDFQVFSAGVRSGDIYLDSGMYEGNPRPYQQWRADNSFWFSLIVDRHS